MKARYLAIAAAVSLIGANVAQAAAPVRPASAPIAAKPLSTLSTGARVGAAQPGDSNELLGSTILTVVIILLLLGGGIIIFGGSSSTPK